MRALLLWHSAEEIEHKSVAFDVYRAVGGGYLVHMLGLVLAAASLLFFWRAGARHLRRQEEGLSWAGVRQTRRRAREMGLETQWLRIGIRSYIVLGFHPDNVDNYHIARDYLASVEGAAAFT